MILLDPSKKTVAGMQMRKRHSECQLCARELWNGNQLLGIREKRNKTGICKKKLNHG